MNIGIAGYGFVGSAHEHVFKDHYNVLINDPHKEHYADLQYADCIIICVSTPQNDNASCDVSNVFDVVRNTPNVPIMIKSTISIEGWKALMKEFPDRDIVFSPEFLRAVSSANDLLSTKTFYIGGKGYSFWADIFLNVFGNVNIIPVDPLELISVKYFRNSTLALKVAWFNQIYDFCKSSGINYDVVSTLVCDDSRIGHSHTKITDNRGFGGHCFPKDTAALLHTARDNEVSLSILEEARIYNDKIRK